MQQSWFDRTVKQRALTFHHRYVEELILRRKPLPPSKNGRCIPLSPTHEKPLQDERRGHAYVSNTIRSSRYTVWDFLPKQILFQVTRLHNFYFICIGIPQAIPGISTTGTYTTILPVLFFLILTIAKEAYDDYRRHRLDKAENQAIARVLRDRGHQRVSGRLGGWRNTINFGISKKDAASFNKEYFDLETDEDDNLYWANTQWRELKVGDIIKIRRDDSVSADVVLLYADGEQGVAYIETMALDGETNLKSKQALPGFRACGTIEGVKTTNAEFITEDPNPNLGDFNGKVTINGKTLPLTLNEIILRSSILRNTGFAIGLVVNTGEECKIRMNANHHPKAKKPRLEHFSNHIVLTLVGYVMIVSFGCWIGYILWQRNTERKSWYISNAPVDFKDIIIGYMIMFNNVIPLAMYVSLEIVKVGQMLMLNSDLEMYDEASDTPMKCNTNTILENLGQISFVLTDKTGTLTENVMKFRKISILGTAWSHDRESYEKGALDNFASTGVEAVPDNHGDLTIKAPRMSVSEQRTSSSIITGFRAPRFSKEALAKTTADNTATTTELIKHIRQNPASPFSRKASEFILALALCNTCLPEVQDGQLGFQAASPDEIALVRAAEELGYVMTERTLHSITLTKKSTDGTKLHTEIYEILDVIEFSSERKRMSIILRCPDGRILLLCKGAETALVPLLENSKIAPETRTQARNSADLERVRQRRSMQVDGTRDGQHRLSIDSARSPTRGVNSFEMSKIVDFAKSPKNSMAITVRATSLEITSGAAPPRHNTDMKERPVPRIMPIDEGDTFARTFAHLNDFATIGLRTLMFAHKTIPAHDYDLWKKSFLAASTALTNRQAQIESAAESIEQSLQLLGVSAIEDKLQAGVPDTIQRLRRANMRIWMLTGDKRETAINIAHSAGIVLPESEVCVLDSSKGALPEQLSQLASDLSCGSTSHTVVVVDGHTLSVIEADCISKDSFYGLTGSIPSVICCRASPAQKASIVDAIKSRVPQALTLAIGDGANDIAMLQTAHVGIGISGREGLAASRVADYSIAQFRFLARLLLVHGHWNYDRTAKFILWTFWKEMFFYLPQALFQHKNGYTGTSLYENWSLTALNTLFTSLCVIAPAVWEQDLRPETLLARPELYSYGQQNKGLNLPKHLAWTAGAASQAIIAWFVAYAAYVHFNYAGAEDNGLFAFGDLLFSIAIMWTNIKLLLLETHYKSRIILGSFALTTAGWWAWNAMLSSAYDDEVTPYAVRGGFRHSFGRDGTWWLTLILVLLILVASELTFKYFVRGVSRILRRRSSSWRRGRRRPDLFADTRMGEDDTVEKWQVLEQDPDARRRLRDMAEL